MFIVTGRKLRTNGNLEKLDIGGQDSDSIFDFDTFDIDDDKYDSQGQLRVP